MLTFWKREMTEVADSVKLFRIVKMISSCEKLQKNHITGS